MKLYNHTLRLITDYSFCLKHKKLLRYILVILGMIFVFLAGMRCGWFIRSPTSPISALELSHQLLERELLQNGELKQKELNEYAAMMHQLADMERRLLEKSDNAALKWQEHYEQELERPLFHEGGSMAPMERDLRGYHLQLERIQALKKYKEVHTSLY